MKRLLANTLMLVGGLTASSQLLALGLGELTLKSALNQPLQAEIELVETDGLSQWEIKPALASASDFERAGVDRLYFLTKITFKVEGDRVVLTSREPVNEPFLNFLVELNWPSGRVLREYTLLLDPPTFQEESIQPLVTTPAGQSSVVSAPAETTTIAAPAQPVAVNRWESEPAAPGTYKVQPNDTLWQIALETRPASGVTPQQMMVAIQNENPNAFIAGNINRLKTHQVLRIPDAESIKRVSFGQAVAEVDRQNRALNTGAAQIDATGRAGTAVAAATAKDGGEVRLLSAQSDNAESAGASGDAGQGAGSGRQQALENDLAIALENVDKSRRENQELRERLESLEEQINTLQRLISLKDDQLATMQVGGAEQAAEAVAEQAETVVAEPVAEVAETAPAAEPEAAPAGESVDFNYSQPADSAAVADGAEAVSEADVAAKAAEEKARRERIAAMLAQQEEQQRPQPTLLDQMLNNLQYPLAGFGVLVMLGLLIARTLKQRKAAKQEEEFTDEELAFADVDADPSSLDDFDFDDDELASGDVDLDADHADIDLGDDLDDAQHHEDHFETVAQTEDVISESDIYIAYGKFEQAVDLLSDAIEKEPSRSDLRLKLLEVYVEMDEAEAFAVAEAGLNQLGDRAASQQAEQLRNRLSSPIAPAAAVSALAAGAAADSGLSLDDDIPALDDSMGDDFADALDFGDALDLSENMPEDNADAVLDLGEAESGLEEVPTLDLDDGLEFDLDESVSELEAESAEGEDDFDIAAEPAAADDSLEFDLGDFDAETPAADEPEVASVAADNESDSLEFDLGSLSADDAAEPAAVAQDSTEDDFALDFDSDDSVPVAADSDLSDLESLLDGDAAGSGELSDLSFDMEENTGFAQADGDDDLKALEQELGEMTAAPVAEADEDDFSFDTSDSDDELNALAAETAEPEEAMDFSADLAELDSELDGFDADDVPVVDDQLDAQDERVDPSIPDNLDISVDGDIDLDELAAADDEFDFLAGTDECATKLDLARAYIDMEDFDGARELLQEVVQEGSDQQKADARSLMDNLA